MVPAPIKPGLVAGMGAAVLPPIRGCVLFASHADWSVVIGEGPFRQNGGSVVVEIDIGRGRMMPVMLVVMRPRQRGRRDNH